VSALAVCLLITVTRAATAQTGEIQEKLNAVLALKRAGALVDTRDERALTVSLSGIKAADQLLDHVRVLSDLQSLELAGTNVTDKSLEKIKGLTKLRSLNLASTKVSNKGLESLKGLIGLA
jgi:hypothetical protein